MTSFPRLDVLPSVQRQIWPELAAARTEGFVLYGGTAIALHLGHRESVYFDFFVDRSFQPDDLFARFTVLVGTEILQAQRDTLTVLARRTGSDIPVKLSFFGGLDFGRLNAPHISPDGVLEVASMEDLLAHKAQALFSTFASQECLKALTYFKDPALAELPERVKRALVDAAARVVSIPTLTIESKTLSTRR